ncbi:hypothetical protein [Bacillus sp. SH8-8]|uniref:hypothetical protein n=1 Tax=Bacillus sp. SH8-8 TaxID=2217830 RepID=UPI0034D74D2F
MKLKRKDLDKKISASIKKELKKYKLKSRGGIYYKKIGQYFIYMHIGATGVENDIVRIRGYVKPYIIDDIFWEVFNMESNSNEPIGLRANAAYKVDGFEAFYNDVKYGDVESLGDVANELIGKCYEYLEQTVESFEGFEDFLSFSKSSDKNQLYDYNLVDMLLLINTGKYKEAKSIAKNLIAKHEYGRFINEEKNIYEYIVDYCNSHI